MKNRYIDLLDFARSIEGSYKAVGAKLGASGPALQAWKRHGAPHRWRPVIEKIYGKQWRAWKKEQAAREKLP